MIKGILYTHPESVPYSVGHNKEKYNPGGQKGRNSRVKEEAVSEKKLGKVQEIFITNTIRRNHYLL